MNRWRNIPHDYAIELEDGTLYGFYGRVMTWDKREDARTAFRLLKTFHEKPVSGRVVKVQTGFKRV